MEERNIDYSAPISTRDGSANMISCARRDGGRRHQYRPSIASETGGQGQVANTEGQQYKLRVLQHPSKGKAGRYGDKARQPIDPPPVIEIESLDPSQMSSTIQNPFFFTILELFPEDKQGNKAFDFGGPRSAMMNGTVVASMYRMTSGDHRGERGVFVFADVNIMHAGIYRFRVTLFEMQQTEEGIMHAVRHCSVNTNSFEVHTAREYGGPAESTQTTKLLVDAGVKLRLRKELNNRRRMHFQDWSVDPFYPNTRGHNQHPGADSARGYAGYTNGNYSSGYGYQGYGNGNYIYAGGQHGYASGAQGYASGQQGYAAEQQQPAYGYAFGQENSYSNKQPRLSYEGNARMSQYTQANYSDNAHNDYAQYPSVSTSQDPRELLNGPQTSQALRTGQAHNTFADRRADPLVPDRSLRSQRSSFTPRSSEADSPSDAWRNSYQRQDPSVPRNQYQLPFSGTSREARNTQSSESSSYTNQHTPAMPVPPIAAHFTLPPPMPGSHFHDSASRMTSFGRISTSQHSQLQLTGSRMGSTLLLGQALQHDSGVNHRNAPTEVSTEEAEPDGQATATRER